MRTRRSTSTAWVAVRFWFIFSFTCCSKWIGNVTTGQTSPLTGGESGRVRRYYYLRDCGGNLCGWTNILIHTEEIRGVVLSLDGRQPLVVAPVRRSNAFFTF